MLRNEFQSSPTIDEANAIRRPSGRQEAATPLVDNSSRSTTRATLALAGATILTLAACTSPAERYNAAIADCTARLANATSTARVGCYQSVQAQFPDATGLDGDLLAQYQAEQRLAAARIDRGEITREEANVALTKRWTELVGVERDRAVDQFMFQRDLMPLGLWTPTPAWDSGGGSGGGGGGGNNTPSSFGCSTLGSYTSCHAQ